ncbi:MAG: hypothetical protein HKN47_00395 [Pirellulaceae bacterium]|nr:hypothetical protein [Pirellulaceae bacterium]
MRIRVAERGVQQSILASPVLAADHCPDDYYGSNESLRAALQRDQNTWRMIHREATENRRDVRVQRGTLVRRFPDVRVRVDRDNAALTVAGGLGFVPVTFTGLSSHAGYRLQVDGQVIDQSLHGNDFWQTDFSVQSRQWSHTYNLPLGDQLPHAIQFGRR